jgi:hypothetical protein
MKLEEMLVKKWKSIWIEKSIKFGNGDNDEISLHDVTSCMHENIAIKAIIYENNIH